MLYFKIVFPSFYNVLRKLLDMTSLELERRNLSDSLLTSILLRTRSFLNKFHRNLTSRLNENVNYGILRFRNKFRSTKEILITLSLSQTSSNCETCRNRTVRQLVGSGRLTLLEVGEWRAENYRTGEQGRQKINII